MSLRKLTFLAAPLLLLQGCATVPAHAPAAQATAAPAEGIVSAADPRAAAAGIEILKAGGNATDAVEVRDGDTIVIATPGGGGYGAAPEGL